MSSNLTTNIEKIKKEKDGLDVLSDIYIYAVLGERVSKEDLIRFQWYGIYQQEETKNSFKLQIPLSLGQLNVDQLKTLAFISKEYAKNSLNLKVGQKIELMWIKMHDLPHIFNLLHNVNLHNNLLPLPFLVCRGVEMFLQTPLLHLHLQTVQVVSPNSVVFV